MKFILGTGNFNFKYQLDKKKKIKNIEKHNIIKKANELNFTFFDTSPDYAEAESIIGKEVSKKKQIITKTSKSIKKNNAKLILQKVKNSFRRLRREQVYGILIHDLEDFNKNQNEYLKAVALIKLRGLAVKTGISLYTPNDLFKLIKIWTPDFIQLPYNILDRRIENLNFLKLIKKNKIDLHVRSIFFKGLLTNENLKVKKLSKWNKIFTSWFKWCNKNNISPYNACISFVLNNKQINKIVLGTDSEYQLKQIINFKKKKVKFPNFKLKNKFLLNPSLWS